MSLRAQFVASVTKLMEEDEKIVLVLGDISVFAFRDAFTRWPERCINIGICEQASVGFCAGLAMAGYYPVFHTIDSFMVRRAYEFIYVDFGIQRLAGMFVSVGGSRDYAPLGPTHMCEGGLGMMLQVKGMRVAMPGDDKDVDGVIMGAISDRALAYVRLEESPPGGPSMASAARPM